MRRLSWKASSEASGLAYCCAQEQDLLAPNERDDSMMGRIITPTNGSQGFPMFTITHYRTPPRQELMQQVLSLAAQNTPEMHMVQPEPSNPMYPLIELNMVLEIHLYMDRMGPDDVRKAGLILATTGPASENVVGFLQYVSSTDMESACAVTYLAVDAAHRRQGIARTLIGELNKLHPHAALTCTVEKVPYYEALGFELLGPRGTQIIMTSGGYRNQARCTLTDASQFLNHPLALRLQSNLLAEHGEERIQSGQLQLSVGVSRLESAATKYAAARLAGINHIEASGGL
ncbi:GNAT family N-acetyltransferase [Pseudomonas sp. NCHU5208]|uniref:GNAT family N-acetyltransferase n=1 Tax=unclassified Pseudomonas TaxID=196821 RepID=UPI003F992554